MMRFESNLSRRVIIPGLRNLRDIGGYETTDGKVTRWRVLLRSDKLFGLPSSSIILLKNYQVGRIIDLRYTPEVVGEPDAIAYDSNFSYLHIPLYELSGATRLPEIPDSASDLYISVIDNCHSQIKSVINELLLTSPHSTIVHCTAGKDRTGIIIALVLGVLQVPDEKIIEDYALTINYVSEILDELRLVARQNGWDLAWYERLLSCKPDNMRRMLNHVSECYGNAGEYLRVIGVSPAQLEFLRYRLLM